MHEGAPPKFILIFLLGFLIAVFVGAFVKKRRGTAVGALLVGAALVLALLVFRAYRGRELLPPAVPVPPRTVSVAVQQAAEPHTWIVEKPETTATRRVEVPDDVKAWARDGIQDFRPSCPWFSEAESARKESTIGDTEFLYWEPVDNRLHGFSEQEPEREAAYRGARLSAQRKLAVLSLVALKREDKRVDVASAQPLAHRLAGEYLREDVKHLEKAKRPYGEVYRAAIMARAGPAEVNGLATAVKQELARGWIKRQRSMTSWIIAIGASLVGAFAVFLFYTFANAGTKGYFAWPLRLASLSFFVLLCAGLFYLRSRLGAG
jgi:hypothetical protein